MYAIKAIIMIRMALSVFGDMIILPVIVSKKVI
jgi:hypothetical protein